LADRLGLKRKAAGIHPLSRNPVGGGGSHDSVAVLVSNADTCHKALYVFSPVGCLLPVIPVRGSLISMRTL